MAFGNSVELSVSTSGASASTSSGSHGSGTGGAAAFPSKAEWQYAPLNMHMEAVPSQKAALHSGSEAALLAAVKQAMIEMDFMGALPEALPTPMKSLAAAAGFYRVGVGIALAQPLQEARGAQIAAALYPKLMAVADEVRLMTPSLATRPELARYLTLNKQPAPSQVAMLSMNQNLLAALRKPSSSPYFVPVAIGAGVLLLGGLAWYFTRKKS